jgi:hypothetical protein
MKLPFKFTLPFVGEKTKLEWVAYEDDVFNEQYMVKVSGAFPERVVRGLYDLVLKKKMGVSFKAGVTDGESVDVPESFFAMKVGVFSWEDVLLKQLDRVFLDVQVKLKWLVVTKHIKTLKIKRVNDTYSLSFEIIGKKTSARAFK